MPRPIGMRKIAGVWYRKEELDSNGMPLVNKNVKGYSDTAPVISNAPVPSCEPTGPSESVIPEISSGTGRLEVQEVATGTIVGGRVQGMHLYSMEEIKRVETQTGLVFVGEFAEQQGALIPVFLRADHDDETRRAKLASIRRGI